jgi:hypothetical protein
MEGSMKMMSWSRYHCLPSSLLRAERRYRAVRSKMKSLRLKARKSRQRHGVPHPLTQAADAGRARTSYFQFVIRLFRT